MYMFPFPNENHLYVYDIFFHSLEMSTLTQSFGFNSELLLQPSNFKTLELRKTSLTESRKLPEENFGLTVFPVQAVTSCFYGNHKMPEKPTFPT